MKLRITRIAAYAYHRRGTLSFGWRYRLPWKPEWSRDSSGWFFGFWRLGMEWLAFDENDPWGERRGEEIMETWSMIANDIMAGDNGDEANS